MELAINSVHSSEVFSVTCDADTDDDVKNNVVKNPSMTIALFMITLPIIIGLVTAKKKSSTCVDDLFNNTNQQALKGSSNTKINFTSGIINFTYQIQIATRALWASGVKSFVFFGQVDHFQAHFNAVSDVVKR